MTLRYHRPVVYGEFPYGHFLKGIAVSQSRTEGRAVKINDLEDLFIRLLNRVRTGLQQSTNNLFPR